MATLESLQAKLRKLEQQAEALIAKQSSTVIEKIRELMAKHGLTIADVDADGGGKRRAKKSAGKSITKPATSAAKYRDPKLRHVDRTRSGTRLDCKREKSR